MYGSDRYFFPEWHHKFKDFIYFKLLCLIPKSYRVKHIILVRLYENHKNAKEYNSALASEIQTVLLADEAMGYRPITKQDVRDFYRALLEKDEIGYNYNSVDDHLELFIKGKGIIAVTEKIYFYKGLGIRLGQGTAIGTTLGWLIKKVIGLIKHVH